MTRSPNVEITSACPSADMLATFAEGRLSGGGRAQVLVHLAECAGCREVVAETVAFLDEDGWEEDTGDEAGEPDPVVWGPWRQWAPVLVRVAAVGVVAFLVALLWLQFSDGLRFDRDGLTGKASALWAHFFGHGVDRERLADYFDPSEIGDDTLAPPFTVYRGGSEGSRSIEPQLLLRIGARTFDLQLVARAGDERWQEQRNRLVAELEKVERGQASVRFAQVMGPDDLGDLEDRLREQIGEDSLFLDLGLWAEAGRIASRQKDLEALNSRHMTRFARTAAESTAIRTDLRPGVAPAVEEIAEILVGGAAEDDLDVLEEQFRTILLEGSDA